MNPTLITLVLGILILGAIALVFWPDQGLWNRWKRMRRQNQRVLIEDALKQLYKFETHGERPTLIGTAGALQISLNQCVELLEEMENKELLTFHNDQLALTPAGAEAALHVIRAHRLWERYLAEETGYQEAEWHDRAEQEEHDLTPEEADKLSFRLGHPTHDPHGDPIPTANGQLQPHGGQPLTTMQPNDCLRIVHIEDEPETVYAQLVAEGIYPGMQVRVIEVSPHRIRFLAGGEEHVLAPIFAANLSVTPVSNGNTEAEPAETLLSLNQGEMGEVLEISRRVRGPERRRLMDMGILPGTKVGVELNGPNGDPRAYRIRGALLALRSEQAQQITIRRVET